MHRRIKALNGLFALAGLALSSATSLAADPPLKRMFIELEGKSSFPSLFLEDERPSVPSQAKIRLITGNLEQAYDNPRYRPDGAITPTNLNLDVEAPFPRTQGILMKRVAKAPEVKERLTKLIDEERRRRAPDASPETPLLHEATEGFLARLLPEGAKGKASPSLPDVACMIATDRAQGGSVNYRDFYQQDKIRIGIRKCLSALNQEGVKYIVMPLIGSATIGTQNDAILDPKKRNLLTCRLLNSIAGIALGIADFVATPHNVEEIGIIVWDRELRRMFAPTGINPSLAKSLKGEFKDFSSKARFVFSSGLRGQPTTGKEVDLPDCIDIFGGQDAADRDHPVPASLMK